VPRSSEKKPAIPGRSLKEQLSKLLKSATKIDRQPLLDTGRCNPNDDPVSREIDEMLTEVRASRRILFLSSFYV
jgi:hypothetical protein